MRGHLSIKATFLVQKEEFHCIESRVNTGHGKKDFFRK